MTQHDMKKAWSEGLLQAVQHCLTAEQTEVLRAALDKALEAVEMRPGTDGRRQRAENQELLHAFLAAKRIEGCSPKTLHYYECSIAPFITQCTCALSAVRTDDIRCYLADYQRDRNPCKVTIDNLRRVFSTFFAWLEDEDIIVKNPVRRIHKVRTEAPVREVLSDEQLERLRDTCSHVRDIALIDLLVSTGMRVGELVRLNRADIDFQERECVVFGKGDKERKVYFNARTKIHLQEYLNSRVDDDPALFVTLTRPYLRLTASAIGLRLRQLGQKCGISKVHPHKFRRTMATMAIDKGMPIEQVQRLLGHTKIDTTLHYAMVNQMNVKFSHRKIIS